ncbi:MAG: DUF4430 domain-containing protein [Oscillospiraceae bacterium]|jgi:hypothetical protein|nr:DUF4430 domain-containing protein [Oscillospiraceae bacterium]
MKKFSKSIIGIALMLAMTVALLSATALAIDPNSVYLTPATGTPYTTITEAGDTVDLNVWFSTYDGTDYGTAGFDNAAQAETTVWSVAYDPSGIIDTLSSGSDTIDSLITATGTVVINEDVSGTASVLATYTDATYGTFSLNLTVAVDAAIPQDAVVTTVYIVDTSGAWSPNDLEFSSVSVSAPADTSDSILVGENQALQNIPTAMSTLDVLNYDESITAVVNTGGSYVTSINDLTAYAPPSYYGWSYAVYDTSGDILPATEDIAASMYQLLDDGYTVVWKFADGYSFESVLNDEIDSW